MKSDKAYRASSTYSFPRTLAGIPCPTAGCEGTMSATASTHPVLAHWYCSGCGVVWCGDPGALVPCERPAQHVPGPKTAARIEPEKRTGTK